MFRRIAPALLLVVCASCSSPADNSFLPDAPDPRGTALGPAGAFANNTTLAWSGASGEIVGRGTAGGGAVLAIHTTTGALRGIDYDAPISVRLSADGGFVAWDSFDGGGDTLALRRAAIHGAMNERVTYAVGLAPHAFALSRVGNVLAWSRLSTFDIEPESIRVEAYPVAIPVPVPVRPDGAAPARAGSHGMRVATLEPGTPVLFSPSGDELLYHPGDSPSALSRWSAATLTSTPFTLGLPVGARGTALRWDEEGIKALYAIGERELWMRDATAGTDVLLMMTPGDGISASTMTWSLDGRFAAVWTAEYLPIQQVTQARLYVVGVTAPASAVVATGTEAPGAIAFSPDSKRVSFMFGSQLRVATVASAVLPASATTPTGR